MEGPKWSLEWMRMKSEYIWEHGNGSQTSRHHELSDFVLRWDANKRKRAK